MAAIVATLLCLVMTIVGAMTLSQGILISADSTAINVDKISIREGETARTNLEILRATKLSWADYIRVTVLNSGQVKLASFDKWDIIMNYTDDTGTLHSIWLPYSDDAPVENEWQMARIGLQGPIDFFEPGILNPAEEMVALINLDPSSGDGTSGTISTASPNGVYTLFPFLNLGYTRLTPQSENITLGSTQYYELVEAAPADGAVITMMANFAKNEIARKLLYNGTRPAKFIYPLIGISQIPSANWTVNYRVFLSNGFLTAAGDRFYLNIDIKVIKKDGTIRNTINVLPAAEVSLNRNQLNTWLTVSGNYNFSSYDVVDENDYLEIDFYGETKSKINAGYVLLSIDDSSLPIADQTRIEA